MELLPSDDTGNALRELENNGSDLSRPLEMDFFVAVPSQHVGDIVASKVEPLNFKVSVEQDDKTGDWTCYCTKTLIPDHSEVTFIEKQLDMLAQPYGGHIDGFGSYGNA